MSLAPNHITKGESNIFRGGGEMGALMRAYDWDNHPLGNPESWPKSLKTNIRLLLNSGFPMFIWWSEDFYMFHNDAYLPTLGDKHPEALGARAPEMWAEVWEQLGTIAERILENPAPFNADKLLIYINRKGFLEETYWTFSWSPAFDDAGVVKGIFCACYEVTSAVLTQRRLKALRDISEGMNQLQSLKQACQTACRIISENSSDNLFSLIYLLTKEGKEAALLGYGGDLEHVVAQPIIELADPDAAWPLAQVLQSKQMVVVDHLLPPAVLSDSSHKSLAGKVVVHPVFRPGQDKLVGFFVSGLSPKLEYNPDYQGFHSLLSAQIATSITTIQAREEAARQQRYLIDIFQQAPVAITILRGPQHIIDLANPSACEVWGRRMKDVINKPILEAVPELNGQGIKELLDDVLQTGVPYVANELPIVLKRNGLLETGYYSFVYQPLRDSNGAITGVITIGISVDDQVESRREIEIMNKQLLAINADLDNFVYAASHDLKAPISNIEGLMQALVTHLPAETVASPTVKRLLNYIQSSVERFKKAIADLSLVTKIQREAGEDVTYVNLAEIISDVLEDFETTVEETGAQVETNFASGLAIRFSAKNMRSVVYNLISNALKYRSPDRPPCIQIATENGPEYTILSVTDNGLGVDLSQQSKIFSMFKRLHDHVEGSGIGLYIVKKIVVNAGGMIEVDSELGEGSTFRIYFKRSV